VENFVTGQTPLTIRTDQEGNLKRTSFGCWLIAQVWKKGWIGDLAKCAKADRDFPRDGDPEAVRTHLSSLQTDSDMFEAVDAAEAAWLGH
jgi:hypothetical protein